MKCKSCGAEQSLGAMFCSNCGESLEAEGKPTQFESVQPKPAQAEPVQSKPAITYQNPTASTSVPTPASTPGKRTPNPDVSDVPIAVVALLPIFNLIGFSTPQLALSSVLIGFLVWAVSFGLISYDNSQAKVMNSCLSSLTGATLPIVYLAVRASTFKRAWHWVAVYGAMWVAPLVFKAW